jgi:serine/threonine protein kinase
MPHKRYLGGTYSFEPNKREAYLGKGAFAKTYRMRNMADDRLCAVKVMDRLDLEEMGVDFDELKSESHVMIRVSQEDAEHFVQYHTAFLHEDEDRDESYYCIAMELCDGGSLEGVIYPDKRGRGGHAVDEATVRSWLLQLARGLARLHDRHMLHRDLKPANVLVVGSDAAGERKVKIADLGLATMLASRSCASAAGTPLYTSPESLRDGVKHPSDDMWALGIVGAEMLLGGLATDGIPAADPRIVTALVDGVRSKVRDRTLSGVVAGLLSMDEEARWTASCVVARLEGEGKGVPAAPAPDDSEAATLRAELAAAKEETRQARLEAERVKAAAAQEEAKRRRAASKAPKPPAPAPVAVAVRGSDLLRHSAIRVSTGTCVGR